MDYMYSPWFHFWELSKSFEKKYATLKGKPKAIYTSPFSSPLPSPADPNGRINIQNWRLLCLVCGVVVPRNRVIISYLQAHLRRCGTDSHTEEGKFAQFCMQVHILYIPYIQAIVMYMFYILMVIHNIHTRLCTYVCHSAILHCVLLFFDHSSA